MATVDLGFSFVIFLGVTLALLLTLLHFRQHRQSLARQVQQVQQLKSLRALVAGLQRHRGLSNGVLAGDESMRPGLEKTRRELDGLISDMPLAQSIYQERWVALVDHWQRLREDRIREPGDNLAQHHTIIRNAIFLLQDVAAAEGMPSGHETYACIWHDVIQAAEWAGQARALGTGMAAAGRSTAAQRVRLRFFHQKIRQLSDKAFATLSSGSVAPEPHLARAQALVNRLLGDIETDLLGDSIIVIPAQTYFSNATATIDTLFVLVDDALHRLETTGVRRTSGKPAALQLNPA
ncbi:hypothetical protein RE428_00940 [Marinobacter nanhaiticus D15-8W]|uniref:Nitrate/nitrite sensing protein domain-containing protein n=1 Tax=Marinobacter nanhaiticus D15-8W TaxID=626887 RepID=N6WW35_9GAMM|nr:nitrate- and nitrite sensing domain-containing protein [Marinobacter nanhaiticus]ENO15222.1 hypothetical protein J057_07726 [Marinobacter nanhaiticus D15-8W]BES69076.1 hypothetical protein RE428_00940 [Marinobacter nanhaiticus D15-8W]